MTTHLNCLDVECYTFFRDDNRRHVDDSSLTVSDLPPLCQKVRLWDKQGEEIKEEFCFETERFVSI